MNAFTRKLWAQQDRHPGDRERLFRAVGEAVDAVTVLYAGSYVDVAASFAFADLTYVDVDRRAERFFADESGVREIVRDRVGDDAERVFRFVRADYRDELGFANESFDLLVSLSAGFVSEHCTSYLRIGGTLMVNPSHGDAAMASIDPRYRLDGVVHSGSRGYRVDRSALDTYLLPKGRPT